MKVGITLPQFTDSAEAAMEAARHAEALGLDGVFCFDHLWPIGHPGRPALSAGPLLGALAASTSTITLGTLVARVGLVPDEVLVAMLASAAGLAEGRFIAGLGTGDRLSRPENDAFGIPFDPAAERWEHLAVVAAGLASLGLPLWVGGGSPAAVEAAADLGAAVNLWEGPVDRVAELSASGLEVTWGGPVPAGAEAVSRRLVELAEAGASWVVCAWPGSLEAVAEAAERVRGPREVSGGGGGGR